ncbi:MAG: hypothetical protein HY689_02945 [Chloroflexi bacterium]|nr:hypothetical protein [Chloroflexota bacterium]
MAPTAAEIVLRADISLDALRRFVNDLPGLDEEWEGLGEYNQAVLMMEWAQSVDSLIELDDYARAGQLIPGQAARLAALKHDVRGLLPLITKLGWYRPPVALLEDVA